MNKYQEALNTLVKYAHESPNVGWALIHEENILQELIDRETPMKPTKNDKKSHDWNSRFCPNCGLSLLFKGAGCINNYCRQKLDWSDKE